MQLYGLFAWVDMQSQGKVLMAAQTVFWMSGTMSHGSPIKPIVGVNPTSCYATYSPLSDGLGICGSIPA